MSDRKSAFIFTGPPGAGKGTIAQVLEKKLNWEHLSTGDLCRKHIAEGTELGKQIDFAIKSGKLVDDTVIIDMVAQWIEQYIEVAGGIVFDGFPRTLVQAKLFVALLKEKFKKLDVKILKFEAPDELIVERLSARRICQNEQCRTIYSVLSSSSKNPKIENICDLCGESLIQRSDDNAETVKTRLIIYRQHAQPLLDFYKKEDFKIEKFGYNDSAEDFFKQLVMLEDGKA